MGNAPFQSTRFGTPPNDTLIDFPIGDLYRNWAIARGLIDAPYVSPNPGYMPIPYPFDTATDEVWFAEHRYLEPPSPRQKQPPLSKEPRPEDDLSRRYKGEI